MMHKLMRVCLVLVAVVLGAPAFASPVTVEFGGARLQQLRSGNSGQARFTEYGKSDGSTIEKFTLRYEPQRSSKVQTADLIRSIRAKNPGGKIRMLERSGSNDVMISYLIDRPNSGVALMLWRVSAVERGSVVAIYQMDFDIENDAAKDRVTARAAEHALAAFDTTFLTNLISRKD